jgi:short-subunit dehydrogenase involved in D-alanine esterification of teichoic acids
VLLVQVNDNLDIENIRTIFKEVQTNFPNNQVLIANHHILNNLKILRPEDWLLHNTELSVQELLEPNWEIKL